MKLKLVTAALIGLMATPGWAQGPIKAPSPEQMAGMVDKGDTTWMLISSVLVLMMSVPGLALFYGGLVRTKNMLSVLMQVLMFASPIIYPLSAVPPAWRDWYLLNPLAGIVSSFRDILLRQTAPDPYPLGIACAVTAIVLPLAYLFFKHAEATMADLI